MGGRLEVGARLTMNPDDYVRGSRRGTKETKVLDKEINKVGKTSKKTSKEFSNLSKKSNKAGKSTKKTAKDFASLNTVTDNTTRSVARLAGYIGPAVIGAALVSSTRKAAEFEKKMSEVSTLLDDTSSLDGTTQSVREMAIEFGSDAPAQASAMYQIISAGAEDAAEANEILAASNKLAIGGVTEISVAADGLTSILNAYGDQVEGATSVSDAMFVAMKAGKTTIGELAGSIGGVAPLAATLGIELEELLAAVAALTKGGVSTSEAMTGLQGVLVAVTSPTAEAVKLAKELGIEFNTQSLKAKKLSGFLAHVKEKTEGNTEAMATLFGRVEGLTKVLALTGEQADDFTDILGKMKGKAGETEVAFGKMTDNFDYQWDVLIANFNDVGISIGDGVLPPLTEATAEFNNLFTLLRSEASLTDIASGWMNSMALGLDDIADRLGLVGEPLNAFAKILQLVTKSTELTIAEQKELDRQFAEGEKSFKGLRTESEWLDKQFDDAVQMLDDLGESQFEAGDEAKEHTKWLKGLAAAADQATREFDELLRELDAEEAAAFKVKKANIDFTKSFEDQIKVLRVRTSQGELAARVEEDWIRAQADHIDTTREQIEAYYAEIGALEGMISETDAAANQWGKIWDNAVENMQRETADLWYGLFFEDPIKSWSDFTDTALEAFKRMVAEMVNAWFVSGIIGLLNGDGISGFSAGNLFSGATNSSGVLSNGASLLSGGGSAAGSAGSLIGAGGGASLYASSGLAADSWLGANVAFGAGDVSAGVSGLTYGSTATTSSLAVNGGGLLGPEVVSTYEAGTAAAEGYSAAVEVGTQSTSVAGGAIAAWGAAAVAAYIVVAGAMKSARIDKENARMTDEFNRLRTATSEFNGELVQVTDTFSIVGQAENALYLNNVGGWDERTNDLEMYSEQLDELGVSYREIYADSQNSIMMLTGSTEAIVDAQKLIASGFDAARVTFTQFQGGMETGLTQLTAKFTGGANKWREALQGAMDSGKVSAEATFNFIENDEGQMFLNMKGQAGEWANFLASQGRVASSALSDSFNYIFSEGDNMFGNLTSQALSFQNIINSIQGPSISGSFNASAPGAAFNGPYKTGLERVPYDNYPAIIDKDEAVLTAPEADLWRTGKQRVAVSNVRPNSGSDNRAVVVELQAVRAQIAQTNAGLAALQTAVYASGEYVADQNQQDLRDSLNNPGQLRPAA